MQAPPAGLILSDYLPLKPRLGTQSRGSQWWAQGSKCQVMCRALAMPYLIGMCHYTVVLNRRKALSTTLPIWRKFLQMCSENQMFPVVKLSALRGLFLKKKRIRSFKWHSLLKLFLSFLFSFNRATEILWNSFSLKDSNISLERMGHIIWIWLAYMPDLHRKKILSFEHRHYLWPADPETPAFTHKGTRQGKMENIT